MDKGNELVKTLLGNQYIAEKEHLKKNLRKLIRKADLKELDLIYRFANVLIGENK